MPSTGLRTRHTKVHNHIIIVNGKIGANFFKEWIRMCQSFKINFVFSQILPGLLVAWICDARTIMKSLGNPTYFIIWANNDDHFMLSVYLLYYY